MAGRRRSLRTALAVGLGRVIARTDRGMLRPVWRLLYEFLARAVALTLCWGETRAAAYVRGSTATGTAVHGVSDIDLVLVLENESPGEHKGRTRVIRRWQRLVRGLPPLGRLFTVVVYMQAELETAASSPAPTFGLAQPRPEPLFNRGRGFDDPLWLRARPGLYGPTDGWRRLRGPDRAPPPPQRTTAEKQISVWLELAWLWRHAIAACLDVSRPWTPYLLVKLVSEPVKMLLWLRRGERFDDRRLALLRGLEVLPQEEDAIRAALSLLERLPRGPAAPLEEMLAVLVRLSRRIAAELSSAAEAEEQHLVRLVGTTEDRGALPLADWRAIVLASPAEERFHAVATNAADPDAIALSSRQPLRPGVRPALRYGELLLLPLRDLWTGGVMRTLQFSFTDPVSFALLEGSRFASFPSTRGLALGDWATRAVAEHQPRLAEPPRDHEQRLLLALTAARAALLAAGAEVEEPVLPLTPADTAEMLAEHGGALGTVARDARAWLRDRREVLPPALADELLASVAGLPPYAGPS